MLLLIAVRSITTMNAMDESRLLGEVSRVLEGDVDRERNGLASLRRSGGQVLTGGRTSTR